MMGPETLRIAYDIWKEKQSHPDGDGDAQIGAPLGSDSHDVVANIKSIPSEKSKHIWLLQEQQLYDDYNARPSQEDLDTPSPVPRGPIIKVLMKSMSGKLVSHVVDDANHKETVNDPILSVVQML